MQGVQGEWRVFRGHAKRSAVPGAFTFLTATPTRIELNAAGELPKRIKVLAWGENNGANGKFILNATSAALLPQNQRKTSFDRVALDFEHNTVKGSAAYKGEPAPIAGNGDVELVVGDGLYLNNVGYTDDGTKFVGGKHYLDVSPALTTNAKREVIFLHSVGAVRNGAIPGLEFSLNSADGALATLFQNLTTNSTTMPDDTKPTALDYKKLLLEAFDLAADATDEQIAAAVKAEKDEPAGSEPETNAAKITGLETQIAELTKKFGAIETNGATVERTALLADAARQGKVVPKAALELNNVQLKALITELPATVPVDQRTVETNSALPANVIELNSTQHEVMQALGLTKERWDKHAKA